MTQSPPDDAQAKSTESAPYESQERQLLREVAKRGATTDVLRRIDALLATRQPAAETQEPMAWMTPGGDVSRSKKWCEERCFPGGEQPFPLYTRPVAAQEGWQMVAAEPTEEFTAWLEREIPPGTIISRASWWAPKIWRALLAASQVVHERHE